MFTVLVRLDTNRPAYLLRDHEPTTQLRRIKPFFSLELVMRTNDIANIYSENYVVHRDTFSSNRPQARTTPTNLWQFEEILPDDQVWYFLLSPDFLSCFTAC